MSITYPSSDSQGDQWLVAQSLEFFYLLHSTDSPATTWLASFVTLKLFLLRLYVHFLISHYWPPMICLVVLNMEVSSFDWTPPFFTPLQLFGNPELLSYNAAFTPSCVKQSWGPPAELWIQFRRHLSPGIRRKYCYCFPSEPPSSSRLPIHVSTSNCQCQSALQQTKGNNPPASTISSTTHLLYSPESTAASLHALWDLKGAPNTSRQQHAMIHRKVHAKANLAPAAPG